MNIFKAILSLVAKIAFKLLDWSLRALLSITIFVGFMLIHLVVQITSDVYKLIRFTFKSIKGA